ncbi:MAG: DUF1330 domain-containing protein [Myxococcales bacterium]|nr:DUF1330 domain-containing protein [Myxococcales bacterium]
MAAYIIVHLDYQEQAKLAEYQKLASPTMAPFGIRLLGKSLDAKPLEGEVPGRLTVLLEADSVEAAERWFHSPEYQRAAEARRPVSSFNAVVVPAS